MPFLTDLDVRILSGGDSVLLRPLQFQHRSCAIIVPAGFVTDFASIPRVFRALVTGQDNTRKPSVVHDYLYRKRIGTRAHADAVFRDAMADCGVDWVKRSLIWGAVRLGGWISWRS